MYEDFHLVGGHVHNLLDLDLALLLGLEYRLDKVFGVFTVGNLGDGDGALVDFLDLGPHLHTASPLSVHVLGTVGRTSGGEVGVEREALALEDGYGCVDELVEVVGQDLGGKAHADAVGALCKQKREAYGKLRRLVVAAVVGLHGAGDLGVEEHFLGKLAQAGLDVSGSGVGVTREDVSPVSLAVDGEAFLPQGNEGAKDRLVAVRMELHGLTHNVCHLGVGAVVHAVHGVQDAALDGFETVGNVGDSTVQDYVRGVIEIPVLEHSGELELT